MATPTNRSPRPTTARCEVCGRVVPVAARGRIASMHPACVTVANDFARLERAVDTATDGFDVEEMAAFRRYLVSTFMHWTNGKFNAAKVRAAGAAGRRTRKAIAAAAAVTNGLDVCDDRLEVDVDEAWGV